jgi:hypothetical protein
MNTERLNRGSSLFSKGCFVRCLVCLAPVCLAYPGTHLFAKPRQPNVVPGAPVEIRIVGARVTGNGDVTITWTSEPGVTYRVQFKNALDAATWSDLRDVTATGSLTAIIDDVSDTSQRFYRIARAGP